jgi:Proton-conducting membrane transporter
MGFVTLGIFIAFRLLDAGNIEAAAMGIEGAYIQMISHGFISGALFLCVGVLYDRLRSRRIQDYGGVANRMPKFAALAVLFSMANCGLPGTSGFVGEFFVILSDFGGDLFALDGKAGYFWGSKTAWGFSFNRCDRKRVFHFRCFGCLYFMVRTMAKPIIRYHSCASESFITTSDVKGKRFLYDF